MSANFNGSTNLRVNTAQVIFSSISHSLVTCWFRLDTNASGDFIWNTLGTVNNGISLVGTGELRLQVDRATTDSNWVTTNAGVTTGVWYYLAIIIYNTTTPAYDGWIGTESSPPKKLTWSATTAGVGALVSYNGLNLGARDVLAGSFLFGQISQVMYVMGTSTNDLPVNEIIYDRWIWPIWSGTFTLETMLGPMSGRPYSDVAIPDEYITRLTYVPLDNPCFNGTETVFPYYTYSTDSLSRLNPSIRSTVSTAGTVAHSFLEHGRRRTDLLPYYTKPSILMRL